MGYNNRPRGAWCCSTPLSNTLPFRIILLFPPLPSVEAFLPIVVVRRRKLPVDLLRLFDLVSKLSSIPAIRRNRDLRGVYNRFFGLVLLLPCSQLKRLTFLSTHPFDKPTFILSFVLSLLDRNYVRENWFSGFCHPSRFVSV